jgi:hypothetical protein
MWNLKKLSAPKLRVEWWLPETGRIGESKGWGEVNE